MIKKIKPSQIKIRQSAILEIDLAFDVHVFFPEGEAKEWDRYTINETEIWCKCSLFMGASGLEGDLALYVPPKNKNSSDAWEGSRGANEFDLWAFLNLMTCPVLNDEVLSTRWELGVNIIFFYGEQTFFDSPLKVTNVIRVSAENSSDLIKDDFYFDPEMEKQNLCKAVQKFLEIFSIRKYVRCIDPDEFKNFLSSRVRD